MSQARRRPAVRGVSVLVPTQPGGPPLGPLLDALTQVGAGLDQVVVCGVDPEGETATGLRSHALSLRGIPVTCVAPPRDGSEPAGVPELLSAGEQVLADGEGHWVWVLGADARPRPGSLDALLEPARRSGRVGVVGPKLVQAGDPRTVVGLGHTLSRAGRPVAETSSGWVDQGQFDHRGDVLGVPLNGMLVRTDVYREAGGLDPSLGAGTEGLDLCWRVHLRGHRVVVAPAARVEVEPVGPLLETPSPRGRRRRLRRVALARTSLWSLPFRAAGIALASTLSFLALLLLKAPRAALTELADLGAVLVPWPALAARWRFRGRRLVRDRDLAGLFVGRRAAWRSAVEGLREEAWGRPRPRVVSEAGPGGGLETGPAREEGVTDGVPGRRWWSPPLVLAVLAALALVGTRWRDLLPGMSPDGFGLVGGEVSAVRGGAADLWWSWWLPWSGAGLGSEGGGPAWLAPMAALTWLVEHVPGGPDAAGSAAVATAWVLLAAPLLSALTAYLALGVATGRRALRALGSLAWVVLAPLPVAVGEGRLGPVVVHVLAPLAVGSLVAATDRTSRRRAFAAACAAALVVTVAAWWVPLVLLWGLAAALVVAVSAPGAARWGAPVVALAPVAALGPGLLPVLRDPWLLLGGPGAGTTDGVPPAWQLLLLHPGGPADPSLWWSLPLWLLAVAGVALSGRRGRLATSALALSVGALTVVLVVVALPVPRVDGSAPFAGGPVLAWPGTLLSLCAAGVLVAASLAADALLGRAAADRSAVPDRSAAPDRSVAPDRSAGWPRAVAAVALGVALVSVLGLTAWQALGDPGDLEVAERPAPVVAVEQAVGPGGARLLTLSPEDASTVRYALAGAEPGLWVRDRTAAARTPEVRTGADEVTAVVDAGGEPGAAGLAAQALADLAVGYVLVQAEEDHPVVQDLDLVPGLTRVSSPDGGVLWRTGSGPGGVGPGRLLALDRTGEALGVVPMTGPHGSTVAALPEGTATVRVSVPPAWSGVARVRGDGVLLAGTPVGGVGVDHAVPPGARGLEVDLPPGHRTWWTGVGVGVLLLAFLALPVGGRPRRGTP